MRMSRAVFEEVRRGRVTERVGGGSLGDPGTARGILHDALEHGLVKVMSAPLARLAVAVGPRGGEQPLPDPFAAGIGILPGERGGQFDPAGSLR